ncbi:MAG TPA: type II 3-dehydroquinate dehydratase [Candidatus Eisenbacteria bacterium]|nr:type II 3-dehydroquinate dehydratase [Candidatus Eisenbacteria bacterium]
MAQDVWVLHGPNLNLLGRREPKIYGRDTLAAIDERLAALGEELGLRVTSFQSNHEGALIDRLQIAMDEADGVVLNAGALTHTSMAIGDTLRAMTIPVVEVHLSNLYARERERQTNLTAAAAAGVIMGFGPVGYELALRALAARFRPRRKRGGTR